MTNERPMHTDSNENPDTESENTMRADASAQTSTNASATAQRPPQRVPEIADLIEGGFTDTQIMHMRSLRAAYPFVEYVDSRRQWERLQFLKWRFMEGDLQRDESADPVER